MKPCLFAALNDVYTIVYINQLINITYGYRVIVKTQIEIQLPFLQNQLYLTLSINVYVNFGWIKS